MLSTLALLLAQSGPLQPNALFSDGMVLQRNMADPVFGSAAPNSIVTAEIAGRKTSVTADKSGNWLLKLHPLREGGPYELKISSGADSVTIKNILVGEVWVASGQSNMEFVEANANDFERAKTETQPQVRMFTVQKAMADTPKRDVKGIWEMSSPATIGHFSAVGFSFAQELSRHLNVPIGIIHTSWGGTPAESWTSRPSLMAKPNLRPMVEKYVESLPLLNQKLDEYRVALREWMNGRTSGDNEGFQKGWASAEFDDSAWKAVPAASQVDSFAGGEFLGAFWYRKEVELPASWVMKELKLELGPIDDYDDSYFDGIKVGRTDDDTENAWSTPRVYRVAPGIVRAGKNVIAIRVFNQAGPGGMMGPASAMKISLADGSESIPLTGDWKVEFEKRLDPNKPRPQRPLGPGTPWVPSTLYNAMIAPLIPYGIRGAIWYQGESNAGRAYQYRELFPTMIEDWRKNWGQGAFPFDFVQLANFQDRNLQPVESDWAELREAQTQTLAFPNTGQAVIIDIGEAGDIHPKNKREVGRRLALNALAKTYHQPVVYGSPLYESMKIEGDSIRVTFKNGSLSTFDGRLPRGFAIAGEDHKFVWADARIDGSSVTVRSPMVSHPVAVRYGWSANPDVNLTNLVGLPASPFRTDDWPGVTRGNQ